MLIITERKCSLGRQALWKDNIKIDLTALVCAGVH